MAERGLQVAVTRPAENSLEKIRRLTWKTIGAKKGQTLRQKQSLILSMHVATVERKNSLLTGRNLQQNQAQCERPSATTDWRLERTEQRHKKNKEALIQEYFLWEGKVNVSDCSSFSRVI
ncbi:hypothetical protein CRENBAI_008211 [Crenichthys baileyi]|uniref:Uncharacterized protein n=1 Tax=Crenichthys baileyi TaxID=28760 RepID=A0AAV9SEN0_9TELE